MSTTCVNCHTGEYYLKRLSISNMEQLLFITTVVGASIFVAMMSLVLFIVVRIRIGPKRKQTDSYINIDAALDSGVTSCYTTEYVQHPHKQGLERTSTIPFELPVPPKTVMLPSGESSTSLGSSSQCPTDADTPSTSHATSGLGQIDPDLYDLSDDDNTCYDIPQYHIGRLWFSLEYKAESERLVVTVIRAKNLQSKSMTIPNVCDSYVRVQLLPEERRILQTKLKKKTCHPKYNDDFVFQVSSKHLEERTLKLTVFEISKQRKHTVLGHVLHSLKHLLTDAADETLTLWRDIEREPELSAEKGEVFLSMSYNNQIGRITVGVYQTRDLQHTADQTPPDFYCKVSLLHQSRVVKTKRTDTVKKSVQPAFNESFAFKLTPEQQESASISVILTQYSMGHKDKAIGRVTIGPFMFARGRELAHWNEMLANQKQQISYWHKLA